MTKTEALVVRCYQPEDQSLVIALWTECGLVRPWNNPKRDIERKLLVDPKGFLVGEIDGRLIATCMAGYEGHRGWINYLAVAPDCRRQGIGAAMMDEAERWLRAIGCPKINLQVRETNLEVIEFYRSIGFSDDHVVSFGKRLEEDSPFGLSEPAPR